MNKNYFLISGIICFIILLNGCIDDYTENSEENEWVLEYGIKYLVSVTDVMDGDTFDCILPNGTEGRVRILGIDTPETTASGNKENEYENVTDLNCLASWGLIVKSYAKSLLDDNEVYIEFDSTADFKGYYGRWLAYVFLKNGTDYNEILLNLGYARVYEEGTCSKESSYLFLQNQAKSNNVGLWNCSSEKVGLVISFVHYDAEGDDRYNLNDEYVILEYITQSVVNSEVNLTGYNLSDEAGNSYQFPSGFILQSSETVTIHTGTGLDNSTDLYWSKTSSIWNNDHDTAYLKNDSDHLINSYSW